MEPIVLDLKGSATRGFEITESVFDPTEKKIVAKDETHHLMPAYALEYRKLETSSAENFELIAQYPTDHSVQCAVKVLSEIEQQRGAPIRSEMFAHVLDCAKKVPGNKATFDTITKLTDRLEGYDIDIPGIAEAMYTRAFELVVQCDYDELIYKLVEKLDSLDAKITSQQLTDILSGIYHSQNASFGMSQVELATNLDQLTNISSVCEHVKNLPRQECREKHWTGYELYSRNLERPITIDDLDKIHEITGALAAVVPEWNTKAIAAYGKYLKNLGREIESQEFEFIKTLCPINNSCMGNVLSILADSPHVGTEIGFYELKLSVSVSKFDDLADWDVGAITSYAVNAKSALGDSADTEQFILKRMILLDKLLSADTKDPGNRGPNVFGVLAQHDRLAGFKESNAQYARFCRALIKYRSRGVGDWDHGLEKFGKLEQAYKPISNPAELRLILKFVQTPFFWDGPEVSYEVYRKNIIPRKLSDEDLNKFHDFIAQIKRNSPLSNEFRNMVVNTYFSLPPESRTPEAVMNVIDQINAALPKEKSGGFDPLRFKKVVAENPDIYKPGLTVKEIAKIAKLVDESGVANTFNGPLVAVTQKLVDFSLENPGKIFNVHKINL